MFDISPAEKVGVFTVKAKVMGVDMEKVQVHIQVIKTKIRKGRQIVKFSKKIFPPFFSNKGPPSAAVRRRRCHGDVRPG